MSEKDIFEVRDLRNKQFFQVNDVYLNGYARKCGIYATGVYLSLCRHASREQKCFPSKKLMAQELGISERSVYNSLAVLEKWNIIKKEPRERKLDGSFRNTVYILLDKSVWEKDPPARGADGYPPARHDITHLHVMPNKDTHIKDTHTLSRGNEKIFPEASPAGGSPSANFAHGNRLEAPRASGLLKSLTEENFLSISQTYSVPIAFVRSKYDDLVNYCERTGKRYKNYLAALRNFVKQDALKLRKEAMFNDRKRGIDATNL